MSKRKKQSGKTIPAWAMWGVLALIILVGGGLFISNRDSLADAVPETAVLPVGPTTLCQTIPDFVRDFDYNIPALSTSAADYVGLVLLNYDQLGNVIDSYQHPSWVDAGYLGPITRDRNGDSYVAPVPKVSLVQNPPADQNKIYRIDNATGEMTEFMDLPFAQPIAANNPFGTIGLTYDCDTHSLYATTLAGSTASEEIGRIYRIDLNTGEITDQLDNVDAIGVGTFNGLEGKRLYYGSARTSDIYSIALDAKGDFVGEARPEFSLAALENGGQENARRISFTRDSMMNITAVEFTYSLHAAIDESQIHYKLRYLPGDTWDIVEVVR